MKLTSKEVWALSAAVVGQMISWSHVSSYICGGFPFFESWVPNQSPLALRQLDILRRFRQPLWVSYLNFFALTSEIMSVYLASDFEAGDSVWGDYEMLLEKRAERQTHALS